MKNNNYEYNDDLCKLLKISDVNNAKSAIRHLINEVKENKKTIKNLKEKIHNVIIELRYHTDDESCVTNIWKILEG